MMGSYTGVAAKTATLVSATVDTVTLDKPYKRVRIVNHTGSVIIWVKTARGSADALTDPTDSGDNCIPVLGGATVELNDDPTPQSPNSKVKLIATGTPKYTVYGVVGAAGPI